MGAWPGLADLIGEQGALVVQYLIYIGWWILFAYVVGTQIFKLILAIKNWKHKNPQIRQQAHEDVTWGIVIIICMALASTIISVLMFVLGNAPI